MSGGVAGVFSQLFAKYSYSKQTQFSSPFFNKLTATPSSKNTETIYTSVIEVILLLVFNPITHGGGSLGPRATSRLSETP